MINRTFRCEGWLYLWHKDNSASINASDVEAGDMMYVSIQDDLAVDGYDGTVGKPEDFREKLYVEFESNIDSSCQFFSGKIDEDGFEECCEAEWVKITKIL